MRDGPVKWWNHQDGSPDVLGPCGCTDYHMADCPLRTDRYEPDPQDAWYGDD